jgi:hypothetical protein
LARLPDPSSRGDWASGYKLIQLQHPMANVAILGQMGGGGTLTVTHHLVKRGTLGKTWVRFLTELTEPSGSNFEALSDN